MATPSKVVGRPDRQIRWAGDRELSGRCGGQPQAGRIDAELPRKPSSEAFRATVPQTDTGGLVEYTEVDGRTFVKELGKFVP